MPLSIRVLRGFSVGSAVLALGACAGVDVQPDAAIARAETSVRQAEQSGAAEYGVRELALARDKLTRAQDAMDAENFVRAERLAEQAGADAELAAALAQTEQTEAAAAEIRTTIAALRREAARQ